MTSTGSNPAIEGALRVASDALGQGDLDGAEAAFKRGLEAGEDPRLVGGLALIALQRGDLDGAIEHGRKAAVEGAPVEVWFNLGWALEQRQELDEAAGCYQSAFLVAPVRPEPALALLRLQQSPDGEDGAAEPVPLDTLQRLDLYGALAEGLRSGELPGDDWTGTHQWAVERGAPWGPVAGWLVRQGAHTDSMVMDQLSRRDEHLGDAVIAGMLLGEPDSLRSVLQASDDVLLIGADDRHISPAGPGRPLDPAAPFLVVRHTEGEDRAQIPLQRTHAALVFGLFSRIIGLLGGEEPGAVFTVDSAVHIGPRRVWMIGGIAEAEVVASWSGKDSDGNPIDPRLLPGDRPVPAGDVPLLLPKVDAKSLRTVVAEASMEPACEVEDGVIHFDADAVGQHPDAWAALIQRLAGWVPDGQASVALWRQAGDEKVALLHRKEAPTVFTLTPAWPAEFDELELPVPAALQLLGRALMQAPRSGKLYG